MRPKMCIRDRNSVHQLRRHHLVAQHRGHKGRVLLSSGGQFAEGKIDLLVGTQMIAKGLDFPRVTCVGVINADLALQIPDFRASERVFQ